MSLLQTVVLCTGETTPVIMNHSSNTLWCTLDGFTQAYMACQLNTMVGTRHTGTGESLSSLSWPVAVVHYLVQLCQQHSWVLSAPCGVCNSQQTLPYLWALWFTHSHPVTTTIDKICIPFPCCFCITVHNSAYVTVRPQTETGNGLPI